MTRLRRLCRPAAAAGARRLSSSSAGHGGHGGARPFGRGTSALLALLAVGAGLEANRRNALPPEIGEALRCVRTRACSLMRGATDAVAPGPAQPAVLSPMRPCGLFLTVHLAAGCDLQQCAALAARATRSIEGEAALGVSSRVWTAVQAALPAGLSLHAFDLPTQKGSAGTITTTGGDLFLHLKASDRGTCFKGARMLLESLPVKAIADAEDIYGFMYDDDRDLHGYRLHAHEMTPQDKEDAAIIPTTGGSYALAQLWRHRLFEFGDLDEASQDAVIGRCRSGECIAGGFDLDQDPAKLAHAIESGRLSEASHLARVTGLDQDGSRLRIVRQAMPCGGLAPGPVGRDNTHEPGLFYLSYANDPMVLRYFLARMVGAEIRAGSPPGPGDSLLKYNQCLRSQMYYVPSRQQLAELARAAPATK